MLQSTAAGDMDAQLSASSQPRTKPRTFGFSNRLCSRTALSQPRPEASKLQLCHATTQTSPYRGAYRLCPIENAAPRQARTTKSHSEVHSTVYCTQPRRRSQNTRTARRSCPEWVRASLALRHRQVQGGSLDVGRIGRSLLIVISKCARSVVSKY